MKASKNAGESLIADQAAPLRGTRTSARQREKHKRMLQIEREKEIARQQAGKTKGYQILYCARFKIFVNLSS